MYSTGTDSSSFAVAPGSEYSTTYDERQKWLRYLAECSDQIEQMDPEIEPEAWPYWISEREDALERLELL